MQPSHHQYLRHSPLTLARPPLLELMSNNEIKGQYKQVKGSLKEAVGNLTGNKTLTAKGKIQNLVGKAQEKIGQVERHADERNTARQVGNYENRVNNRDL